MENTNNEQQKEVTINDAFQVWWWIAWRTGLIIFGINIFMGVLIRVFNLMNETTEPLIGATSSIIRIVISIVFFKKALNRKYKGFELIIKK